MSTTPNFGIVCPEGTDTFAPLTFDNNAYTLIDSVMKANQDRGITTASCVVSGGIVTLTRTVTSCAFFVFTATADFNPLETVAVDGVTVTVKYADGTTPEAGAWVINQSVLCYLNGTLLNVISTRARGVSQGTVGALSDLETTDKSSIVNAINENTEDIEAMTYHIGDTINYSTNYRVPLPGELVTGDALLYVFVPLSKPVALNSAPTVSGEIGIKYQGYARGNYSLTNVTSVAVVKGGIVLTIDVSSLSSLLAKPAYYAVNCYTSNLTINF